MPHLANLFQDVTSSLDAELSETLLASAGGQVRIERIVTTGQASPEGFWYDQDEHEWVVVLEGEAELLLEGDERPVRLQRGDFVHLPPHRRHRVTWTSTTGPTVWLAVFYRDDTAANQEPRSANTRDS